MDIRKLRTFCKVAEMGSVTKAAEALYYTEPAVSQQIRALERELGVVLFERHHRSVSLTPEGRTLYSYARRILELHEEAVQVIRKVAPSLTGEVHLAASTIPGEHLLPPLLVSFRKRYPDVHLVTVVTDSEGVLEALQTGRADFGVLGFKPFYAPKLTFEPWVNDELVLVVPPDHPWVGKKRLSLHDLREEPFIVREPGSGTRLHLEQSLRQVGLSFSDLKVVLELGSNEAVKEAVRQKAGVTILSRHTVERELQSGQLVTVPALTLKRTFYFAFPRRRPLSPAAQKLLDFLKTSLPTITTQPLCCVRNEPQKP